MSTRERREPPESPDTQAEAVCGPCEACGCEIGTDGNCVWCAGDYPPHTHDPVTPSAEPDGEACTHSPRCMAFPDECCRPAPAQDGEVAFVESMLADRAQDGAEVEADYFDVVFDGPPSHECGRFIEVENPQKASISVGKWLQRPGDPEGWWVLRIPRDTAAAAKVDKGLNRKFYEEGRAHAAEQIAYRLEALAAWHLNAGTKLPVEEMQALAAEFRARAAAPAGDERE